MSIDNLRWITGIPHHRGLKYVLGTPPPTARYSLPKEYPESGTLRAKDLRKNLSILQEGGLTPVPLTLLVIRIVSLHTLYGSYKGF